MIGATSLQGGLYAMLKSAQPITHQSAQILHTSIVFDSTLWHFWLGHLSNGKLDVMKKKFPFIHSSVNNNPCDCCHLAKQK